MMQALSPTGVTDTLTIVGSTAARTGNLGSTTKLYRIACDALCHVKVVPQGAPDADTDAMPLFENTSEYIEVPRDHEIAIFGASGSSGTFWYTHCKKYG